MPLCMHTIKLFLHAIEKQTETKIEKKNTSLHTYTFKVNTGFGINKHIFIQSFVIHSFSCMLSVFQLLIQRKGLQNIFLK